MKRLLITAAAALTLVGPLAATTAYAQDWYRGDSRSDRYDNDRRDGRYDNDRRDGRYDNDRRDNRGNGWRRDSDRDGVPNRVDRWDNRRDNGYYWNGRFYRGAPPSAYYGKPGFRVGYRTWARGEYIPRGYRVYDVDYRSHRLAPPPRGYHYVRDDRGDILLAAVATGLIASVIIGASR